MQQMATCAQECFREGNDTELFESEEDKTALTLRTSTGACASQLGGGAAWKPRSAQTQPALHDVSVTGGHPAGHSREPTGAAGGLSWEHTG